ncbi:MAG: alpha/beta hydrolase [Anaerolineae bacterium]
MKEQTGCEKVDRMLDVGGYRLHFSVDPGGQPAILLEAGGGADASFWDDLVPAVSRETGSTVVTYDRAGYGESDLPDAPFDIRAEVGGLWKGLEELGLARSLVVLGHSLSGLHIVLLAQEHPEAVRGLVFMDPMTLEFIDYLGGAQGLTSHPLSQHPFDASQPEGLTRAQRAGLRTEAGMGGVVEAMRGISIPRHIPVRVITAGVQWWPKPEECRAWREAHAHLADSVDDGRLIVAEHSAHFVSETEPELVIAALKELVARARG